MSRTKLDTKQINVLYVDDEESNLDAFTANFRKDFKVFTANSAQKGKELLKENEIHVIVSDQRMPDITGVQFLEEVLNENPDPVRIILTGYTDSDAIIEAINKGRVFRYLMKPFDKQELKDVIETAYEMCISKKKTNDALSAYEKLFDESGDAAFKMDSEGNFIELNKFGQILFKIPENKVTSTRLAKLFNDFEDFQIIHKQLIENKPILDASVKLISLHGATIDSFLSIYPLTDGVNKTYKGIIRDITKIKEKERLLLRAILEDQENEKSSLIHELRESIGQELYVIKLHLELMLLNAKTENYPEEELLKSKETLLKTVDKLNSLCNNITPSSYKWLGFVHAVRALGKHLSKTNVVNFRFEAGDDFPRLNSLVEISMFRIVQEFVQNSLKHTRASEIVVAVAHEPLHVYLLIKDNGGGFDVNNVKRGNGLKAVRSRVESYNGVIRIQSKNGGTEYHIILPLIKAFSTPELN